MSYGRKNIIFCEKNLKLYPYPAKGRTNSKIQIFFSFSRYSKWPNYYTYFVFVDRIKSPIIDNTHIKTFS